MGRNRRNTVRIIGGAWRSRLIEFPDAADLRPTPDRVRETLFNWLGQDLSGRSCLDLFAGSGALGFEALSRGAREVTMVEKSPVVARALRENAALLGAHDLTVEQADALEFARAAQTRFDAGRFDVIFVDPPYRLGLHEETLERVAGLLASDGRVYVESDSAIEAPPGWSILKRGRAGAVHFQLLGRKPDDQGSLSGNV